MNWRRFIPRPKSLSYLGMRLALPMGSLMVLFLLASILTTGWMQNVLINLSAISLGVLITVFYIDRVLQQHEAQRWVGAKAVATTRLMRIATRLINDVARHFPDQDRASQFDVPYGRTRAYQEAANDILFENDDWLRYVREEVIPCTRQIMECLGSDDLDLLTARLQITDVDLRDVMTLFSATLSPHQIEIIMTMLDEIRGELHLIAYRKAGAPNRLPPDPADLLRHSLALIEASN